MTTSTRVEDAKLRDMLAAAEAATRGRRVYVHDEDRDDYVIVCEPNDTPIGRMEACLDAEFAGECDPDTIRSILSELLELREAVKPFVDFLEQGERLKHPIAQSFCDIETGTSAALYKRHFVRLRSLSQGGSHEQ